MTSEIEEKMENICAISTWDADFNTDIHGILHDIQNLNDTIGFLHTGQNVSNVNSYWICTNLFEGKVAQRIFSYSAVNYERFLSKYHALWHIESSASRTLFCTKLVLGTIYTCTVVDCHVLRKFKHLISYNVFLLHTNRLRVIWIKTEFLSNGLFFTNSPLQVFCINVQLFIKSLASNDAYFEFILFFLISLNMFDI